MNNIYKCKKCGSTNTYLKTGDTHTGLYCVQCNSWIKWVSKNEITPLNSGELKLADDTNDTHEINIEVLEQQRNDLNIKINEYYKRKIEENIANNSKYIGKTFKRTLQNDVIGYYRIISVDNGNQYRMNTLTFTLPIKAFERQSYETDIMSVDSIGWFCDSKTDYGIFCKEIDTYTEITAEEFNDAFNTWLEKIKVIINDKT